MAKVVWRAEIPGFAAVAVLGLAPEGRSVYVADGWGRLPAGENAVEVFPDAGVAFTAVGGGGDSTALACVAVG